MKMYAIYDEIIKDKNRLKSLLKAKGYLMKMLLVGLVLLTSITSYADEQFNVLRSNVIKNVDIYSAIRLSIKEKKNAVLIADRYLRDDAWATTSKLIRDNNLHAENIVGFKAKACSVGGGKMLCDIEVFYVNKSIDSDLEKALND